VLDALSANDRVAGDAASFAADAMSDALAAASSGPTEPAGQSRRLNAAAASEHTV
jgi:hypothetical protein